MPFGRRRSRRRGRFSSRRSFRAGRRPIRRRRVMRRRGMGPLRIGFRM